MPIAIIPARKNSQRIKSKNKKSFLGEPIIARVISKALASELFDQIVITTDDPDIQKMFAKTKLVSIHKRPPDLAGNTVGVTPVVRNVIDTLNLTEKDDDVICVLFPTSVIVPVEKLKSGYEQLLNTEADFIITVGRFPHPIQRALSMASNHLVSMDNPDAFNSRTQDNQAKYFDAGQFYWSKAHVYMQKELFPETEVSAVILEEHEFQDIDEPSDWQIAEMKFKQFQLEF